MKRLILIAMGMLYITLTNAQSEVDALRYSQTTFGGTARYNSMAGAFGALGADFSVLSSNPAGIAMFRKNEVTFTPAVFNQNSNSLYNGSRGSDEKFNFNFGNGGIIGTYNTNKKEDQPGWVAFNCGFGYHRLAKLHNRSSIQGSNNGNSSLSDIYVQNATNKSTENLSQFDEGLAFNTYLIDSVSGNNKQYFSYVPWNVMQQKFIETEGSMGETVLSFGGNYNDKLYLGATIGFQHIRYSEQSTYSETATEKDTLYGFESFKLNQKVTTRGTGINVKLGVLYRLNDWIRMGAAFHSPTVFTMHDEYVYSMKTKFASNSYDETTPNGTFDYSLITPPKGTVNLGLIIAKRGLIGLDFEFVDYTYARLNSSPDNSFFEVNNQVRKKYTTANNLRVGAEWKIVPPITLRAGYAFYGSPYKSGVNTDAGRRSITAGIGFRENNYFIDLAYVRTQYSEDYYLYEPTFVNKLSAVRNSFSASSIMATLGVRF